MRKNPLTLIFVILLVSCESEFETPKEVELNLPSETYWYSAGSELGTLGRVLFYDQQLSVNNTISCASCHKQALAFADDRQFSRGFNNLETERNSMPIQNLAGGVGFFVDGFDDFSIVGSSTGLFWDGRGNGSASLLLPIVNHIEMGISDLNELSEKLSKIAYYPPLFADAFEGDPSITPERLGFALQAFTHSISSNNTRMARSIGGLEELSPKEEFGMQLFITKYDCNSCHQVQDPQGYIFAGTFANIGLETNYVDEGLESTTQRKFDNGKFKIPSLRNVALTAPYMHDGRFETLEEVIQHYNEGVVEHPNLDARLRDSNGNIIRPNISEAEAEAIIAFLGTLTDHTMITDVRFSNPFETK